MDEGDRKKWLIQREILIQLKKDTVLNVSLIKLYEYFICLNNGQMTDELILFENELKRFRESLDRNKTHGRNNTHGRNETFYLEMDERRFIREMIKDLFCKEMFPIIDNLRLYKALSSESYLTLYDMLMIQTYVAYMMEEKIIENNIEEQAIMVLQ